MSDVAVETPRARTRIARGSPKVDRGGVRYIDKITLCEVRKLKDNPRNSRTHTPDQVNAIAASIKQFGFTTPVMVDSEGMLIAGHGRVLAAKQLGMTKVPTINGSYLTAQERQAYIIADNAIPLSAGWDLNVLVPELDALKEGGMDLASLGMASLYDLVPKDDPDPEEAAPRNRRAGSSGTGMVVQYNIVFDDVEQQQAWFKFLRGLKTTYPDEATIGARLAAYLAEHDA